MTSAIYQHLLLTEERWAEYNIVRGLAEETHEKDEVHYAIYYKCATIFLVAYLESFLKDLAKALVDDLNSLKRFSLYPTSIQRTVCWYLSPQIVDGKVREEIFRNVSGYVKDAELVLPKEAFLVYNQYDNDAVNPTPGIIEKITANFGVKNPFALLNDSKFEDTFSATPTELEELFVSIKTAVYDAAENFPYKDLSFEFQTDKSGEKKTLGGLWFEFVNNVLLLRHKVAHGETSIDAESPTILKQNQYKMMIFQLAISSMLMSEVNKNIL